MISRHPKRILMTADPIGGIWTFALELGHALEPYGIEFALATMGGPLTPDQHDEIAAHKNIRLFESDLRLEWMDDPWPDVAHAGEWLLEIGSGFRPDLVHLNGYSHAVLPWNAPVVVTAHSCVLSWWQSVKNQEAPPQYDEYRRRVARGLSAADLITAPSLAMRHSLAQNYGCLKECAVIHNGRDPRLFRPGTKKRIVFACGRIWDEAKNLHLLDRLALELEWPIEIAGDCRHPSGAMLPLRHARCLGKLGRGEMAERFAEAAIFVQPACYEPFGLSPLEAGLSGCALVLGDISSLRELWADAAIFVSPNNPSGLRDSLDRLIHNEPLRIELGTRARARALEFSSYHMGKRYLAAYQGVLNHEWREVAA
jgi:glycosyltransferase involved in cell wall biosynthesis